MSSNFRIFAYSAGASFIFYHCHSLLGTVVYCEGISMEPTIQNGDYLLVERLSLYRKKIRTPQNFCHILKRVRALQGDVVEYFNPRLSKSVREFIPEEHIWLEGDNQNHSLDSRVYGPVPLSRLEYKVFCRLWPPSSFGKVCRPEGIAPLKSTPDN
ncbi:IMP1 inner mitochondrial membrane peptidase-like [Sparganum proliferum]